MAGTEGVEEVAVVAVSPDRPEPAGGPNRLKTLADEGLEYLGRVVKWAAGVLAAGDGKESDPLAEYTPKQKIDAARTGTVAAIELANKKYPKLTQNRNETVDMTAMAKALLEGGFSPEEAERRLAEMRAGTLPDAQRTRRKVLAGAREAEGGGNE